MLAVEYQGNFVKVMLDAIGADEFIAYVPERTFFRDPYAIGDVVLATWPSDLARLLAKTNCFNRVTQNEREGLDHGRL